MITLATTLWTSTACVPAATAVAPMTPPISACDELDGNPKYQVITFQAIAPSSPANTIGRVTTFWSTMPFAMVAATLMDRNAPTKLRTPHRVTAARGFSALVAIEVATALAVSWKPLVKSNATAVTTTMTSRSVLCMVTA